MSLITWNASLILGLPSLDEQHQQLVRLLNELHDDMIARQAHTTLGSLLDALFDYTEFHFSYEESLLARHGYRAFNEHRALHEALRQKVNAFREQHHEGRIGLSPSVLEFLRDWLLTHIGEQDARYVRHLRAKGVV
jgi:hemerythrin-like metal-binding protein